MAREDNAPWARGKTFGTTSASDGANWLGYEKVFEDIDYSAAGPLTKRSNRRVVCRLVRNSSGAALEPKRLATFKTGTYNTEVDAYADTLSERSCAIDEFLPSTGAAANDIFWAVVEGPALITTSLAGDAGNNFVEGDMLVAATGATTNAGRVRIPDYTGSNSTGSALAALINNAVGRAMSARTTANTGGAATLNTVLVDMCRLK